MSAKEWDCLDSSYVADRIRNSPLHGLGFSSPATLFTPPSESSLQNFLDTVDLAYIRDSLALICDEVLAPVKDVPLVDILNLMRAEINLMEIGGPRYVDKIIDEMKDRITTYDEDTKSLLEDEASKYNGEGLESANN